MDTQELTEHDVPISDVVMGILISAYVDAKPPIFPRSVFLGALDSVGHDAVKSIVAGDEELRAKVVERLQRLRDVEIPVIIQGFSGDPVGALEKLVRHAEGKGN